MGNTVGHKIKNLARAIPVVGLVVPLIDIIDGDGVDEARADFGVALNSTIATGITITGSVIGGALGGPAGAMIGGMIGGAIGNAIGTIAEAGMAQTVHNPKLRSEMADFSAKSFAINVGFGAVGGALGGGLGGAIAEEVGWASFKQFMTVSSSLLINLY